MESSHLPVLAALLLLAGCGGAPGDLVDGGSGIGPTQAGDPAVALGFTAEVPVGSYTSAETFELFTTPSIRVVADFSNVGAEGVERLELRAPSGIVWFTTVIPFSGATGSDRSVTELPDGSYRVVFVLEVAGTPIETYQMTGAWTASAVLDGTSTGASGTFQLR
jgi:hypothetical protein